MSTEYPQWTSRHELSGDGYTVMLGQDLRGQRATVTVHRLDRSQIPTLSDPWHVTGPRADRRAVAHGRVREVLTRSYADVAAWSHTRWVRVVDLPLVPVMRREVTDLWLHAECGARIRVVTGPRVALWERSGRLSDILVIGADVVYEVRRDQDGVVAGAHRAQDRQLADHWRQLITHLYDGGEDATAFCRTVLDRPPTCPGNTK